MRRRVRAPTCALATSISDSARCTQLRDGDEHAQNLLRAVREPHIIFYAAVLSFVFNAADNGLSKMTTQTIGNSKRFL